MLRTPTFLLGLALLALGVVVALMFAGVVPAQRASVVGALIAGEPLAAPPVAPPVVTPIDGPIAFEGTGPRVTDAFGLREGQVVLRAVYDGRNQPFSAVLRALDDAQPDEIASVVIIPPLDPQGAATGLVTKAGRFVLAVELAVGLWTVTVAQPS